MKFNPEVARLHLQQIAKDLSHKPKHAGRVARIEAVLALHGWPFTEQRFREFCRELRIIRRIYVAR